MKIAHVIASLDPAHGGPPVCASNLAAAQAQHGHQVSLVFPRDRDFARYGADVTKKIPSLSEIELVGLPVKGLADQYFFGSSARRLAQAVADAEMVHIHGVWDAIVIQSARIAAKMAIPYAICPHGMLNRWSLGQKALKKRLALELCMRGLLLESKFVHVLNENEAANVSSVFPTARPLVFPNGIFPEAFDDLPPAERFRALVPTLGERPYVLFLGRLHHVKGLDYLLEAFRLVANQVATLDLVIAGPDEGEGDFVAHTVAQLGLADRVQVVGPLYGDVKLAAIVGARCLVQPSRQEGFSMSIAEALACGTPVVISDSCHFPEVAQRGAGYVVRLDGQALAEAIVELARSPTARATMGRVAREMIRREYSWTQISKRMLRTYEAITCHGTAENCRGEGIAGICQTGDSKATHSGGRP